MCKITVDKLRTAIRQARKPIWYGMSEYCPQGKVFKMDEDGDTVLFFHPDVLPVVEELLGDWLVSIRSEEYQVYAAARFERQLAGDAWWFEEVRRQVAGGFAARLSSGYQPYRNCCFDE